MTSKTPAPTGPNTTLEERLAACAEKWRLEIGPKFGESLNHVYAARHAGGPLVLKVSRSPDDTIELRREAETLAAWEGDGAVRLLSASFELGAILVERADPGVPLRDVSLADDDRATATAADVMRQLRKPVPERRHWWHPAEAAFPTVADWFRGFGRHRDRFDGGSGPLDAGRFDQAERLYADLLASSAEPVLLHGDLHHLNILSDAGRGRAWLAIDPKGVIGEPAYEPGALLRNPFPQLVRSPGLAAVMTRRVEILADTLGFDARRIRAWAFAQAVLSAVWSIEDGAWSSEMGEGLDGYWMTCAEALDDGMLAA